MKLLIATWNKGKTHEIRSILCSVDLQILTLEDIGIHFDVEETGTTYQENAEIKANAYYQASGLAVLSDDSGLEVDALHGKPGIKSARFSPKPNASDRDRRMLLLEKLSPFPQPWHARFVCCATLILPDNPPISKMGYCDGSIVSEERGTRGFGYDPIFQIAGSKNTMAELDLNEKNKVSHRANAIRAIIPFLVE